MTQLSKSLTFKGSSDLERWRLITTWGADPGFNMGLDETLLEGSGRPPTLRLYSWSPDTLSLGYFQRYADVPGTELASQVVRRLTGGGAIHHVNELTFSISVPREHRLYRGAIAESYERIHSAIAAALGKFGLEAHPRGPSKPGALLSDRTGTGMCFHASTALDLVWQDRKGVGSAQRRRGARILHHGSIKLDTSPLEGDVATLSAGGRTVSCDELGRRLVDAFRDHLQLDFERTVPEEDERHEARERGFRYLDPAFVQRR